MESTLEIGDQLRDHVISLLEARGSSVKREIRSGSKKVDIIFTQEDEIASRQIAIECKNYDQNLSQKELTTIYADYLGLLEDRTIDELWVIVRTDYTADAKNFESTHRGLHCFTLAGFEQKLFGFHRYARSLSDIFLEQKLDKYYVQQRVGDQELLRDFVQDWINSDETRPLAILGGYGMGKTSFCKYLVNQLANNYLADPFQRVPIYIRLSQIAKEQELSGLLSNALAADYRISNYNFNDTMRLNEAGKFVIVFDGFDEMKHALTWEIFKYNFSEINRTVAGKAKVIIAGRPNAFLSDIEHSWALQGTRLVGDKEFKIPGAPLFIELTLRPFSTDEAEQFLQGYLHIWSQDTSSEWIAERINEIKSLKIQDELSRPVHLQIFASLAAKKDFQLRALSVFELYDIAIDFSLQREMEKPERLNVPSDTRKKIVQETAWWLWEKDSGRNLSFNPHVVPRSIWSIAFQKDELTDDAMLREIYSGAFLERKYGENFYFAHRSFMEFFVALKLLRADEDKFPLAVIDAAITPEVLNFLRESGKFERFANYVTELMTRYSGELKLSLLITVRDFFKDKGEEFPHAKFQQRLSNLLRALPIYEANDPTEMPKCLSEIVGDLTYDPKNAAQRERAENAMYFIIDALMFSMGEPAVRPYLVHAIQVLASAVGWSHLYKSISTGKAIKVTRDRFFERVFLRAARVTAEIGPDQLPNLLFDLGRAFSELTLSRPLIVVANRTKAVEPGQYLVPIPLSQLGSLDGSPLKNVADVLRFTATARW